MGDRLVNVIRNKEGKLLAASYQHWEASNWKQIKETIEDNIASWLKEHNEQTLTQEDAVYVLYNSLKEYNDVYTVNDKKGSDYVGLLTELFVGSEDVSTQEDMDFAAAHPDINSDQDSIGRNYGMIIINEKKVEDWEIIAEWENEFEV